MLAGFEQPTTGEIVLDGQNLAGTPPYRRPVNMMFQSYALFPHMTVEKNIAFGLRQDSMPKAEIAERVAADAEARQAGAIRQAQASNQLRAASASAWRLARSLAKRPKVLLLDEPLGARLTRSCARRPSLS